MGKILKRKQKLRISRGKERAEAVGAKVARKKGMGRRGVGRNVSWVFVVVVVVVVVVVIGGKEICGRGEGGDTYYILCLKGRGADLCFCVG